MRLRKNGVLPYQAAVWCAETVGDRVRVTRPCAGWLDKADIIEGQIVVVSAAGGATCRKDLELDSEVVGGARDGLAGLRHGAGRDARRQAPRQGLLARRGLGLGQVPRADLRPLGQLIRGGQGHPRAV